MPKSFNVSSTDSVLLFFSALNALNNGLGYIIVNRVDDQLTLVLWDLQKVHLDPV